MWYRVVREKGSGSKQVSVHQCPWVQKLSCFLLAYTAQRKGPEMKSGTEPGIKSSSSFYHLLTIWPWPDYQSVWTSGSSSVQWAHGASSWDGIRLKHSACSGGSVSGQKTCLANIAAVQGWTTGFLNSSGLHASRVLSSVVDLWSAWGERGEPGGELKWGGNQYICKEDKGVWSLEGM